MLARSPSLSARAVVVAAGLAAALLAPAGAAFASGGTVIRKTDGTFDGYFYSLAGTGVDRYMTQYDAPDFDAQSILCGARVGEINPSGVVGGPLRGDLRFEDPGNPGFPDLTPAGLVANVDPASVGTCSPNPNVPRLFTFGGGGGIPAPPMQTVFLSAIEPLHGPGANDVCGLLTDTNSPISGACSFIANGIFVRPPFDHFNEIIAFGLQPPAFREGRAHGKPRFPGDEGLPVYFARRPAADAALPHRATDDVVSITIVLDNPGPLLPVVIDLSIAVDLSVIAPGKGFKEILRFFRTVGTGTPVVNPITVPDGRTILRLGIPGDLPARFQKRTPVNMPFVMTITDHGTGLPISSRVDVLGLRKIAGIADDSSAELFVTAQPPPSQPGDAINVKHAAIDLPTTSPYRITGLELVAGEFGGAGQPGLDAVELRTEDFVFTGSPDLSPLGLLRSVGIADGIGEVPTGPPPTTVTLDLPADLLVDPTDPGSFVGDLFVSAVQRPGESAAFTAIGADRTIDTILPYSSATRGGVLPAIPDPQSNYMLRLLLNGEGGTVLGGRRDRWNGTSKPYALALGEAIRIPLEELMP